MWQKEVAKCEVVHEDNEWNICLADDEDEDAGDAEPDSKVAEEAAPAPAQTPGGEGIRFKYEAAPASVSLTHPAPPRKAGGVRMASQLVLASLSWCPLLADGTALTRLATWRPRVCRRLMARRSRTLI